MSNQTSNRATLSVLGVVAAAFVAGSLFFTREAPALNASPMNGPTPDLNFPDINQLFRGQGDGATLGPGMFVGEPTAKPNILQFFTPDVKPQHYCVNVQNSGDTTLMLIKHSEGEQMQVSQIPPTTGSGMVLRLGQNDKLQLIGLGDGQEVRFVWSARQVNLEPLVR